MMVFQKAIIEYSNKNKKDRKIIMSQVKLVMVDLDGTILIDHKKYFKSNRSNNRLFIR